ncbi:MAG: tRNA (adenosine(37)-N6)-threonylcarbamoyltransferase complex ATPase subunit type 1 TsaE [Candidatus Kerfeldbacteria bacterium]|nr:tRNA (adenosine(37)-N6)-threonylcarbamoyltransferase complex ATPase subunit type 1 TsaE [Candidatus Kerfeldbacteria bacterium]
MNSITCQSQSEGATRAFARMLATRLSQGGTILLTGELGAGKTTFVQGLADELGVTESITSPTFSLVALHPVTKHARITQLVHVDLYRLLNPLDIATLDLAQYQNDPAILLVIEWSERCPEQFTDCLGTIQFTLSDYHDRQLLFTGQLADLIQ